MSTHLVWIATGDLYIGSAHAFAPGDQIPALTVIAQGWDLDGTAVEVSVEDNIVPGDTIQGPFVTEAELTAILAALPTNAYSASTYGVTGVTGTNMLTNLQAASTAVAAAGGGNLYLPAGTIDIGGYWDVPSGVNVVGPGKDFCTIKCTAASSGVRFGSGGGSSTTTSRFTGVGGFGIDGNATATGGGLFLGLMAQCSFQDIWVQNCVGTGIRMEQTQNTHFKNVEALKNTGWNWTIDYGAGGLTFDRCQFTGQGTGSGANLGNLRITATGVNTGGGYSDGPTHLDFDSCQFERAQHASATANIFIEAGTHIRFFGGNIVTSGMTTDKPLVQVRATPGGGSTTSPTHLEFIGVHFAGGSVSGTHYGWAIDFDTYASAGVMFAGCSYANLKAMVRSSAAQTITQFGTRSTASTDAVFVDPAAVLTEAGIFTFPAKGQLTTSKGRFYNGTATVPASTLFTMAQAVGDVPLVTRGMTGQTAKLLSAQTASATEVFSVSVTGDVALTAQLAHTGNTVGFYSTTPVTRPATTPVAATDLATALTLVNYLRTRLLANGLIA